MKVPVRKTDFEHHFSCLRKKNNIFCFLTARSTCSLQEVYKVKSPVPSVLVHHFTGFHQSYILDVFGLCNSIHTLFTSMDLKYNQEPSDRQAAATDRQAAAALI